MWSLISFLFILDCDAPPRLLGHRFSRGENQFCVSAAHAFSKGAALGGDHNSICTRKCIWYIHISHLLSVWSPNFCISETLQTKLSSRIPKNMKSTHSMKFQSLQIWEWDRKYKSFGGVFVCSTRDKSRASWMNSTAELHLQLEISF